jgi:hypothetical protein
MGPPLSPGLPPGQDLDEKVWLPHTKSCLFHRNSRCADLRCLHPLYASTVRPETTPLANMCAIPGGRKSILRDAAGGV